jgi:bifunctional DNA-binding transcriptional regulator/antitoxin component of YhaV-PrlF toxin-antitoxin module
MHTIEFETRIDNDGHIYLPDKFRHVYGKAARLVVVLPEPVETPKKKRRPGSAIGILEVLSEDNEHLDDFCGVSE